MPTSSKDPKPEGVVKHRACDECRTRKLACSKEVDGCSRCKRERIRCVYSPQKPMGRPRKRRNGEGSQGSRSPVPDDPNAKAPVLESFDFSFLEGDDLNMEFLDLLGPTYGQPPAVDQQSAPHPLDPALENWSRNRAAQYPQGGRDVLGEVNFDNTNHDQANMARMYHRRLAQYQPPDSQSYSGTNSSSTTPSNSDVSDSPKSSTSRKKKHPSAGTAPCQCLSAIFLSLESLNNLPQDPFHAICVARNATRAAYNVIHCPSCSLVILYDPSQHCPMQSYQNLALLSALIPTICNGYARILEVVTATADKALAEGHSLYFSFAQMGTPWNLLAGSNDWGGPDMEAEGFSPEGKMLHPVAWRQMVSFILQWDVYGFSFGPQNDDTDSTETPKTTMRHLGVKDIVHQLEERSRIRHEVVDCMGHDSISWSFANNVQPTGPRRVYQCSRFIETARIALEGLDLS